MTSLKDKVVISLIGGPGAGKGTIAAQIIKNYDVGYMSAGDLLRQAAQEDTPLGHKLAEQLRNGEIVAQEVTIGLLKREIERQNKELYIIDGFPRAVDQCQTFEREVVPFKATLFISCPDDVLVKRCLKRGQEGSGRSDDNEESLKKRIHTFHTICEPVNALMGDRLITIDGNAGGPEVIFASVKKALDKILADNKK